MNSATLQPQLQQVYRRETWQALLPQLFPSVELFTQAHDFPLTSDHERRFAAARQQFGAATLADGKRIAFYEIQVKPNVQLLANRVGLRSLVMRCIDEVSAHAVFAFFAQAGNEPYRLTYAAKESKLGDDLKIQTEQTAARRYTYILGPGESCRTPADRLTTLAKKQAAVTLADATDAFSVEKLNNEFFADYCRVFQCVRRDIAERQPRWSKEIVEQQTQTLLNRLLFLSFVQRKGWLNRQRDYLVQNFRQHFAHAPTGLSYLDKFLRPVFEKLSTETAVADIAEHDLPFLNGGLFSDEYGAEQLDETIRRHKQLKVSNETFRHVFDDLLEIYNFTIREDSPTDQEVAIDPEMLGKIFESLVLQIEKSDGGTESLRHDTGSHYTPRPIVHYLCTEGLRGWLEQFPPGVGCVTTRGESGNPAVSCDTADNNTWPKRLEKLLAIDASDGIDDAERAILDDCLSPEEAKGLLDRLETLRACDPAVGSGAFPVGLLHELVNLMRLCETRSRGKDPVTRDSNWLYDTKSAIIRRVIYGVDVQERAVEICKLRLWLSLMVDFDIGVDVDNCSRSAFRAALKNITPLPNLDYKIRRADSLIDQVCGHPVILPRSLQDAGSFNDALNKLSSAKLAFYSAHSQRDKRKHHFDILAATADLALNVFKQSKLDLKGSLIPADSDLERLAELEQAGTDMLAIQGQIKAARKLPAAQQDDELQRIAAHFDDPEKPTFVWQLDFAEVFHRKDAAGFDLMLANPPYVRMELFKDIKPELRARYANVHAERADLYVYFYARTIQLLADGGVLSFISSNKWLRAGYGEQLRKHIADACRVRSIIDFGELPVFENAATFPMIFVAQKQPVADSPTLFTRVKSLEPPYPDMPAVIQAQGYRLPKNAIAPAGWVLSDAITAKLLQRMQQAGTPLDRYIGGNILAGIKTGLNEAFWLSDAAYRSLVDADKRNAEIIKPLLVGDNVRKWQVRESGLWLIFTPHGIDMSPYRAVREHLAKWKQRLEQRALEQEWYELQQAQYRYSLTFSKPKIVYPDIAKESRFALDTKGQYVDMTAFVIPSDDLFLLGVLNSQVAWVFLSERAAVLGDASEGGRLRLKRQYMEHLPVPSASAGERTAVAGLVERVLAAKRADAQADVAALEQEIDDRVYRLYGLTKDEIKLVEESTAK